MKKSIFIFFIFFTSLLFSQESESGVPYFNLLLGTKAFPEEKKIYDNLYLETQDNKSYELSRLSSIIDKVSLENIHNENLQIEADQLRRKENSGINIYGKIIDHEINIADPTKRFKYEDRYFNVVEVHSESAKSLQAYFKDYDLPKGATLYIYDSAGEMILGAFTSKNNPGKAVEGGYNFMTQPIVGNKIFIELSYPTDISQTPILTLKSIVHGFTKFYSGPYGEAGNCHKNVVCEFNPSTDKGRNMKSVGLVLANYKSDKNFAYTCSGALLNNVKQDGTPYFLTASHCIEPARMNNWNWQNEFLVLFNYEAIKCDVNKAADSFTTSNNSILGSELLTESPSYMRDFTLLKLKTTKETLQKYKVCYAGWDNAFGAYIASAFDRYSIHHPKGDIKKISLVKNIFPSTISFQQSSVGDYLATSWKNGIVEHGSSGAPLFNSFDRLIGSLSTGPDDQIFNCSNPNIYIYDFLTNYSRFSSNFAQMKQWLDPDFTSVQSIGPYCSSSNISIGAPIIVYPGGGTSGPTFEQAVDINRADVHPSQTFGKKIYVPIESYYNTTPLVKISSDNIIATKLKLYDSTTNKLKLKGIYKIIDCNKIKYIKDVTVEMKNPAAALGTEAVVVGVGDNRVIVRVIAASASSYNEEVQSFKIVNNELVFESWVAIAQGYGNNDSKIYYANNRLLVFNTSTKALSSWYINNGSWIAGSPQTFPTFIDVKMIDDKFFVSEVLQNFNDTNNKLQVYQFQSNSANYSLINTFTNLYNNNNSMPGNSRPWKVIDISKNNSIPNSYYVNYRHQTQGDPFNRIVELNLNNSAISHLNLGGDYNPDFSIYSWTYFSSYLINDKIYQMKSRTVSASAYPGPGVVITVFAKNSNGVWTKENSQVFYQNYDFGINDKYLLQHTVKSGFNVLNVRELEYLFHPETLYYNLVTNTAAYNMIRDLTSSGYYFGMSFGKEVYSNRILGANNIFRFNHTHINGFNESSNVLDNKTIIFSDFTRKIDDEKKVEAIAKYSIVFKPGFSISSAKGTEFHAIPQKNIAEANIPACSMTFDDMLDPQLGDHRFPMYLKQAPGKDIDSPYYGEIVLNDALSTQEVVIDKSIKLYPNPTKDILNIDFNGKSFKALEVHSLDGKKIITKDLSSMSTVQVDLSQYPAGIYMVTLIDSAGKNYPNKIIKK